MCAGSVLNCWCITYACCYSSVAVNVDVNLEHPELNIEGMQFVRTQAYTNGQKDIVDAFKITKDHNHIADFWADKFRLYLIRGEPSSIFLRMPSIPSSVTDAEENQKYIEFMECWGMQDPLVAASEQTNRTAILQRPKTKWVRFMFPSDIKLTNKGFSEASDGLLVVNPVFVSLKTEPGEKNRTTRTRVQYSSSALKLTWMVAIDKSHKALNHEEAAINIAEERMETLFGGNF